MTFVAGVENLFKGHIDPFPRCAPCLKPFDCCPASRAFPGFSRHKVSNRFTMPGDCDGFTVFNFAEELGKVSFCFSCLDFTHDSIYTGYFNWLNHTIISPPHQTR